MKAYIISLSQATVKIGTTIFQPFTGNSYPATDEDTSRYPYIEVEDESFDSARIALTELLKTQ